VTESDFNNADTAQLVDEFRTVTSKLRSEVGRIVVGQDEVVEHLLITLLVGGHCLVTGMPGTAKTLLVRTLATVHRRKRRQRFWKPCRNTQLPYAARSTQ